VAGNADTTLQIAQGRRSSASPCLRGPLSHSHHAALAASDCAATGSPQGPFSFDTWEAGDYKTRYSGAMELAAHNQIFPDDPDFAFARRWRRATAPLVPAQRRRRTYRPSSLKLSPTSRAGGPPGQLRPAGQVRRDGPALVSADCGYGLMQVTSSMQNISGIPSLAQTMIGSTRVQHSAGRPDPAQKWNDAPELRPITGNRDPHVIENCTSCSGPTTDSPTATIL